MSLGVLVAGNAYSKGFHAAWGDRENLRLLRTTVMSAKEERVKDVHWIAEHALGLFPKNTG